jgi:glutathione S-transferase
MHMGLKIYGVSQSRAIRVLWMAQELGVPFEHVPQDFAGEKSPAFLAVNPNGRVPAIDDDGVLLFESMAINLYLAKKYGAAAGLAPKDLVEDGIATQWSFWVMTEIEKTLLNAMFAARGMMGNAKDPEKAAAYRAELDRPFAVLDGALAGKDYLMGGRFTVADLNVAAVLTWARPAGVDFANRPNVEAWLARCLARPAFAKARA